MKILQINAVYGMGSTGSIVRDISKTLIAQGHESYVMWATGCRKDDSGVKLIRIGNTLDHKLHALLRRLHGSHGLHSKAATKKACRQILQIKPDVVHLHNLHSNYIHLPTLLDFFGKHNIPTLLTLHDCWFFTGCCTYYQNENNCQNWLHGCEDCPAMRKGLRGSVKEVFRQRRALYGAMKHLAVHGVSQWTTDAAKISVLQSASNIECIYNWIDTERFQPSADTKEIKEKFGISKERKLILGVAQVWSNNKGLDSFVEMADQLAQEVQIILVGENHGVPERENLRCIGYTANVEELIGLYSAADIFVNPSSAETFGLVTVEAMACGTPVVAYDNSGSAELVPAQCGILVADGNKAALLQAVRTILKQEKSVFASACREHVCQNFEKNKQLQKVLQYYEKIAASVEADALKEK